MDPFAATAELDDASLRAWLAGTDPQARLYAAWALGLRSSDGGVRAARSLLTREPHAGVRRHLAVMLGGDLEALWALVELDPSEGVRSTALRLLVQSWAPDRRSALGACLARVLAHETNDEVLLVAIELASDLDDVIAVDRTAPFLESAEVRVRAAAIDALLEHPDTRGAGCVADASFSWPDDVRRMTWQRLLPTHRDSLIAAARARDTNVALWVELARMAFDDGEMEHVDIAWLGEIAPPLVEEVLRVSRAASIPQAWLVRVAALSPSGRGHASWRALQLLARLGHDGANLDASLLPSLRDLLCAFETESYDEEASDEILLDREWIEAGLARLAGQPG